MYAPNDEELSVDIEELKASTEEYKRQTQVLRQQKEVLEGIRKKEESVVQARAKLREKRRKKWLAERERLEVDVSSFASLPPKYSLEDLGELMND